MLRIMISATAGFALLFSGWNAYTAETTLHGRTFRHPDGMELELISSRTPLLRPVNACFDRDGNLYVTDSSGSSQPPAEQAKDPKWRVLRLADTDHDGIFDQSIVVADNLPMLQGILWHEGNLYIGGTPAIWKLVDKDHDGIADERVEWWNVGHPMTHCGNEVHGPYAGPDGYMYWTKGAFEPVSWTNSITGKVYRDRGAHIFRSRPDGSDMESIMTGGMDNPVEVAFTPDGECIFTSTFIDFSRPGYRDGMAHAIFGGVYGKENSNVEDRAVKRTSPELLHPFVEFGAAAPSGLCRYDATRLGDTYLNNFFATLFNLHKVTRHVLRPQGASFAADTSDFVSTDDVDFHPTDVLQAPDGSLLIVDTGGWYKLCCPTSQLWKPDMLGQIYRIRKSGASREAVAKSESKSTEPRTTVRRGSVENWQSRIATNASDPFAQHEIIFALIQRGNPQEIIEGLKHSSTAVQRASLIASAEMEPSPLTPAALVEFLKTTDSSLRSTAEWIALRRPEWGPEIAAWAGEQFPTWSKQGNIDQIKAMLKLLTRDATGRDLVGRCASATESSTALKTAAFDAMAQSGSREFPESWAKAVSVCLQNTPLKEQESKTLLESSLRAVAANKSAVSNEPTQQAIKQFADGKAKSDAYLRFTALSSLAPRSILDDDSFGSAKNALIPSHPPSLRAAAVRVLTRSQLNPAQTKELATVLKEVGPLELAPVLGVFDKEGDGSLGHSLIVSLRASSARSGLRKDLLKPHLAHFPKEIQDEADRLLDEIVPDNHRQDERVAQLLAEIKSLHGDVRKGQSVFNSSKTACVQCHKIGYAGGTIGPDLTRIGEARTERDLLEAVIFPSASFVRSYEPIRITTKDGEIISGVVRHESDTELTLALGAAQEQRILKRDVAEQVPGSVSVMPGGLDEQMSRQDLADLIAFLKNTKWGAN